MLKKQLLIVTLFCFSISHAASSASDSSIDSLRNEAFNKATSVLFRAIEGCMPLMVKEILKTGCVSITTTQPMIISKTQRAVFTPLDYARLKKDLATTPEETARFNTIINDLELYQSAIQAALVLQSKNS